jgi:hypothetical protein
MLNEILISRANCRHDHIDVHRYATISCRWSRMIAMVKRLFG